MFTKNNIEKNIKECILWKNYIERFERSLHLRPEVDVYWIDLFNNS